MGFLTDNALLHFTLSQDRVLQSKPNQLGARQSAKLARVDVLTIEEIVKLLGELPEPWNPGVYVMAVTGLRVSELLGLK